MLQAVVLVVNMIQTIALAWIAAWQLRAAHEVRKLNGTVVDAIGELAAGTSPALPPPAAGS